MPPDRPPRPPFVLAQGRADPIGPALEGSLRLLSYDLPSMTPRLGIPAALLAATATLAIAACGDDDATESASRAAPAASEFPSPNGRTLLQVLNEADAEGPVISPSGMIIPEGE